MKKLLLASNGEFLFSEGFRLLGVRPGASRICYVTTASKGAENRDYIEVHKQRMRELGYAFTELDIERKTPLELRRALAAADAVHVEGGNSFYLLRAARESGFLGVAKKLVSEGLLYAGTSAGAYLSCPTIETSAWGPKIRDRLGLTDFTAMHLVPFLLKAHYKDELAPRYREKLKTCAYPVKFLRDGQGILVEGDSYRLVGAGKEVVL